MSELVTTLDRNNLRIHKYQKRMVSDVFYTNDQTSAIAASVYKRLESSNTEWKRTYELSENLITHSYKQSVSDVDGDAYTIVCGWGESKTDSENEEAGFDKNSVGRRIVSALSCHTIVVPDELKDFSKNVNNADFGDLTITVYGDKWLGNGCIVAAFFSNDDVPPAFSDLVSRMNTPGAELKINDYYAGYLGSSPDDENTIRYIRTGVICNTSQQGASVALVERDGEKQPLVFKLHDWGVAEYDDETGHYNFKSYVHLMLFLAEEQYLTDRDGWMEGSSILNIANITLTVTEPIECPIYYKDLCSLDSVDVPIGTSQQSHVAVDLQGKLFGLVNNLKLLEGQTSKLSKSYAQLCTWQAIESAVKRIKTANEIYGIGQYPPITSRGFDFYVVDVDGSKYIRIGCVDENAMNFASDTPLPSVYSLVIGYPVNPGIYKKIFTSLFIEDAIKEFSAAITLAIVIYKGIRVGDKIGTDGSNYGFNSNIDKEKFDCSAFFSGNSDSLPLENGDKLTLEKMYFGNYAEISAEERIVFDSDMIFTKPGAIVIGVCPVDFTRHSEMRDGDWDEYKSPGYNSQYMQLVQWPITNVVKVEEVE